MKTKCVCYSGEPSECADCGKKYILFDKKEIAKLQEQVKVYEKALEKIEKAFPENSISIIPQKTLAFCTHTARQVLQRFKGEE